MKNVQNHTLRPFGKETCHCHALYALSVFCNGFAMLLKSYIMCIVCKIVLRIRSV